MALGDSDAFAFPPGEGEMRRLIRANDWRATPLGHPSGWPEVLHTLVHVMLSSSQPMFIVWGPRRTTLYNDAYAEVLAGKHPVLGEPFDEIWYEIWERDLKPIVERAYAGEALHMDDIPLMMMRKGYLEETHFSFSYTPVRGPDGEVRGFFCPCLEITEQVLEQRRTRLRATLTERLRALADPGDLVLEAAELLGRHLDAGQAAFGEIDAAGEVVTIGPDWTDGDMPSQTGPHRLADFGADLMADLQAGRIVAIHDVRTDPRTNGRAALKAFAARPIRAFINIPLRREGRLAAIFAVSAAEPVRWREADIGLVAETADRIFAAVEKARAEAARRATETRLREARNELALATTASQLGWGDWDYAAGLFTLDARGRAIMDLEPGEDRIEDWFRRTHPDDRETLGREVRESAREARPFDLEYRVRHRDGAERIVHGTFVFEVDESGQPAAGTGFVRDVTERKRAEQHQTMLMAELDHRVKNVLAVIQSIARHTLGRESETAHRFIGRVNALARSHMLLADSRWEGANLTSLVEGAVAAYRGEEEDRVTVSGPELKLNAKAAQTLTLAFHELVTNAAKYGALSGKTGRVDISWRCEGRGEAERLALDWRETGGPPIEAEPAGKGFGSFLIEQTLRFELEGEVRLDFRAEGLAARIELPVERLAARNSAGS